jgi:hypothetical protein
VSSAVAVAKRTGVRPRIDVNKPFEVKYWSTSLGCSEPRLREAVNAVGVYVSRVRLYLMIHGDKVETPKKAVRGGRRGSNVSESRNS